MDEGSTANSDVVRRRELLRKMERANARMHGLRAEVEARGDIVRFRMTRHVQWVTELLVDLNARSVDMPAANTYDRRRLERDLRSLEDEIGIAESKLEAARAEEQEVVRPGPEATKRAVRAEASALRSELPHRVARRDYEEGPG